MFVILFATLILPLSSRAQNAQANASGPSIFDVRRSLPLEPDEPVTKDFYINAGPESGMKKGAYISVVRPVPIHDPIANKQQATLNIPVGQLQIIEVQRGITVARLMTELTDEERPTLEYEGVMVGDRVDLGTITTEAPKKSKRSKRRTEASNTTAAPAAPAVPAVVPPAVPEAPATQGVVAAPQASPAPAPAASNTQAPSQAVPVSVPQSPSAPATNLKLDTPTDA